MFVYKSLNSIQKGFVSLTEMYLKFHCLVIFFCFLTTLSKHYIIETSDKISSSNPDDDDDYENYKEDDKENKKKKTDMTKIFREGNVFEYDHEYNYDEFEDEYKASDNYQTEFHALSHGLPVTGKIFDTKARTAVCRY